MERPKRRKLRDNPYKLSYGNNNEIYIITFIDNNIEKNIEVSKDIFNTYYTVEKLGRNLKKQKTKQLETSEDEINELYEALKKHLELN